MEPRWYRQKQQIDLACGECNKCITPNAEFTIFHWACIVKYKDLVDKLKALVNDKEFTLDEFKVKVKEYMDDFNGY